MNEPWVIAYSNYKYAPLDREWICTEVYASECVLSECIWIVPETWNWETEADLI